MDINTPLPLYIKQKIHRPSTLDYIRSFSEVKDRKYSNENIRKTI